MQQRVTVPNGATVVTRQDQTYESLLSWLADRRLSDLKLTKPSVLATDSAVRNTVGALKHFMRAAGLTGSSVVGTELLEEERYTFVLKAVDKLGLSKDQARRVRSEMELRVRPWVQEWLSGSDLDDEIDPTSDTFQYRLGLALAQLSLSKREISEHIGVTPDVINNWSTRGRIPSIRYVAIVQKLEDLCRVRPGFLVEKLVLPDRARSAKVEMSASHRRRFAYHLPEDFEQRSPAEQSEILSWASNNILSPGTKEDFGQVESSDDDIYSLDLLGTGTKRLASAPEALRREILDLISFRTSEFTPQGMIRNSTWTKATEGLMVSHYQMLFGAALKLGYPREALSLSLALSPRFIDEYIDWRYRKRGGHTRTVELVLIALSGLLHPDHGYITQQEASFLPKIQSLRGVIEDNVCMEVERDWRTGCAKAKSHISKRLKELKKLLVPGRSVFEPILPVLESDLPVATYMKIVREIRIRQRSYEASSVRWAEDCRAIMMIRLGLETGFRQKNLIQLRLCPIGSDPTPMKILSRQKCGELYLSQDAKWVIRMPVAALKNANSSALKKQDFELVLKDRAGLYGDIENYIEARSILLGEVDAQKFLVKSQVSTRAVTAEFTQSAYYETYRSIITKYGIYNPYTGRGAIPGLKPHGPHAVRDILATHIIKTTGSYEQAAAIIMDTAETVKSHYARWLPGEQFQRAQSFLDDVYEGSF